MKCKNCGCEGLVRYNSKLMKQYFTHAYHRVVCKCGCKKPEMDIKKQKLLEDIKKYNEGEK